MKRIKQTSVAFFATIALLLGVAGPLALSTDAGAITCGTAAECAKQGAGATGKTGGGSLQAIVKRIINVLLFIIGTVAVIMIIIGGIRYVISGGDASQVTAAKNTILYAVVGLVVAILAYAIVNFVVTSVG